MRGLRSITAAVVLATALTLAGAIKAASLEDLLALGYSTHRTTGVAACTEWGGIDDSAHGYGVSVDFGCLNSPGYEDAISAFLAGHDERKFVYENPDTAAARDELVAKGYAVTVDYASAGLHVTGDCNVDVTLAHDAAKAYADAAPTTAPCPPPPPVTTTTDTTTDATATTAAPTTTTTDTDTAAQLASLAAQLRALAARVGADEAANQAAWDAFTSLLGQGRPAYEAALAARSAGLNAIYELGSA